MDQDELIERTVLQLRAVGASAAVIYAYERTEVLVTDENRDLVAPDVRQAWDDAIEEFERELGDAAIDESREERELAALLVRQDAAHGASRPATRADGTPKLRAPGSRRRGRRRARSAPR